MSPGPLAKLFRSVTLETSQDCCQKTKGLSICYLHITSLITNPPLVSEIPRQIVFLSDGDQHIFATSE
jgi:hypothetical protein